MKQMKVLGVIAMALTLGLTACGGPNQKTCKHKWGDWEVVTAETCTTDGLQKRTCTVCKLVEEKKINKGHKWGSWETVTKSTCTVQGDAKRTCSRCNEVETKKLDLAPHTPKVDAEGNEIIEWETAPTCEAAGVGGHRTCSVCQTAIPVSDAEAAALGHNYTKDADGKIVFTWTTEPTCTLPGVGTKHCERCGKDIAATDEERKALGHDTELIGGAEEAPEGEATVRVWRCKRCHDEFLGFKATEVTAASKQRLVFTPAQPTEGQEQSARFFGHPIGNDVPLNDQGDPDRDNHPSIYNKNQTGDYFEYVFTLNATQAAKLSTVRCYCDAKPADYLGANGIDFWANKSGDEDWTRGMYIDDNPDHYEVDSQGQPVMVDEIGPDGQPTGQQIQKGKEITDYRYVLYVDDRIQEFDPDTKVRVPNGDPRGEYVMPYTFHLKEGKNKISLRMAGGYRSQFYSFVFRPYVEPTQITVNQSKLEMKVDETAQITSSFDGLAYASSNTSIATVDATGLVTGKKAGSAEITVSKDGNYKPAKVPVKVNEKDGIYQIEVEEGSFTGEGSFKDANGGRRVTDAFPKDAVLSVPFNITEAGKFQMKICGRRSYNSDSEFDNKFTSAFEIKLDNNDVATETAVSGNSWTEYLIGNVDLTAGAHTITFKALRETNPINLDYLRFEPAPLHTHDFGTGTAQTDEAESKIYTCSCGLNQIKWDAKKYSTTESSSAVSTNEATGVSGDSNKGIKLGGAVYNSASGTASDGTHVNYNVNVPAAKTGAKLILRGVRNSSSAASMFSSMSGDNSPSYYQKADGTWDKYEWRYKLFVNGVEVEFTPYASGTEPQAPSKQYAEAAFPCTFDLKAGNNKIEIQKWGGFTLVITEFTLEF